MQSNLPKQMPLIVHHGVAMQVTPPSKLSAIVVEAKSIGFDQSCDPKVGSILRTLAATKQGGRILELGTGVGYSTAWLLDGMDGESRVISVENDSSKIEVARKHLGNDSRVQFQCIPGEQFLEETNDQKFHMIFADTWPGKYNHLENTLDLLHKGGLYVVDDMLPQSNWPEGHENRVAQLFEKLQNRSDLVLHWMDWASGVVLAVKL